MPEKTDLPTGTDTEQTVSKQPDLPEESSNQEKHTSQKEQEHVSQEERLAKIEELLVQQGKYAKWGFRLRVASFAISVAAAVAVCIALVVVGSSVRRMTNDVSHFIATAQASVEQITAEFAEISEGVEQIDFETVAEAVEGIRDGVADMDFEALNESVQNLKEVSEKLAGITSIFG